jgi:hypothetical protein
MTPLYQASNGLLYGVSDSIFSYNISSGKETDLAFGRGNMGSLIEIDDSVPTGISHFINLNCNIQLYPNPSSSNINLSLKLLSEQSVNLSLYNTIGQLVWTRDLGRIDQIITTIPAANLTGGIYILKVNAGGTIEQKEVAVER